MYNPKFILIFLLQSLLILPMTVFSQTKNAKAATNQNPSAPMPIWPKGAPGEKGNIGEEKDMTKPTDGKVDGKAIIRLGNVSNPTITVYRPIQKNTGAAVVVCPGGGYHILAIDLEGTETCEWLNSLGITAVLLKYRVPVREGLPRHVPPLQDVQRALGMVRQNAEKWGIDPNRIGVMGYSAGGHLSASVSTNFDKRTYEPIDEADQVSCRPDFTMLIYPAYLTAKEENKIAPELPVTKNTPPTFLVQTQDDGIPVESSLFYYLALKNAGVPAEMHLYPKGGHGYGLRKIEGNISTWPKRAEEWLRTLGMLESSK